MPRLRLRSDLSLVLACVVAYIVSAAQVRTTADRSALSAGVSAVQAPVLALIDSMAGTWQSLLIGRQTLASAHREATALREENERLRHTNQLLAAEVAELRQGAELLRELPSLADGAVLGRVIARDPFRTHTVRIDRGRSGGVRLDSAVLCGSGVLGRVDQVSEDSARVQLLTHPAAAAAARLAGLEYEGLVMGGDQPTLTGLPPYTEVAPDTPVVTTGSEGIYPPNLLIGATEAARTQGLFTVAPVQLAVRPAEALVVLVLAPGTGGSR